MPGECTVVIACENVPADLGPEAATDITSEFQQRGPRYFNAVCTFVDGKLLLSCDNDGWDADGLNLMDEFSDCLSAYLPPFGGDMKIVSINKS
jgi:hypothetical protein